MLSLGKILCLYLIAVYSCYCHEGQMMFLEGPLTNQNAKVFNGKPAEEMLMDIFDCSHPLSPHSRQYFEDLHSQGVTHFKVPLSWLQLLPTGLSSKPQKAVVMCYHRLLSQLLDVGLQPVVVLHRSKVPNVLRAKYGGWESRALGDLFQQYAEFVFAEYGTLAEAWVTLSSLEELEEAEIQKALEAHAKVYQQYHRQFPAREGGGVSIGLTTSNVPLLCNTQLLQSSDFLSIKVKYTCTNGKDLVEQLQNVMGKCGGIAFLFYEVNIDGCSSDNFLTDDNIFEVVKNKDLRVLGLDVANILKPDHSISGSLSHKNVNRNNVQATPCLTTYCKSWTNFAAMTSLERDAFLNESFPDNFQWATSSESFKVEGGWLEGGKGETIWDRFGHENQAFENKTADLACDSYNKVDYDVYLLRGLHVNTYQFSVSWARIFPTGQPDSKSEKGALYYDKLINTLIDSGIQPVVTLYHWDLPQTLQDNGGWTSPSIVEAFKQYADFCFSRFGDRVKIWNTFSSPWVVSHAGYGTGEHAPGVKDYVVASYQVTHNMLKSHAEAWRVYNDKYRKTQDGKVGIALNSDWAEPKDPSKPEDIAAADRYLQFMLGWFAHPIFVDGDYPATLKSQIEQKNRECPDSEPARLPAFTSAESQRIRGTADFFGLNHYTSRLVSSSEGGCIPGPEGVGDFQTDVDPSWPTTVSDWIVSVPWGLRRLLNYISREYLQTTTVPVYITGSGMPTQFINSNNKNDPQRVEYLKNYINEALKAIKDGVDVQRFTVQSLMDGFEGPQGYSERFGLHYVNFDHPDRPRTPRQSAYYYSEVIEMNGFAPKKLIVDTLRSQNLLPSTLNTQMAPSTVPSEARSVWMKFSGKTNVETKLYHYGTFSEGFTWGVSSSAYQIEGGWNADGKGASIWDTFTHTPGNIVDNGNGDVACDSFHRLEEDLYMLRAMGSKSYKFSLSWSRIFPDGKRSSLNQKGVDYYNKLINGLQRYGISPIVTLYHWDLPQALQDVGGWESEDMIDIFNDFCDFCFATFGDRVKFWITIHQPQTIAWSGYGLGSFPPKVQKPGTAPYIVAHNLVKAHAKAYHTYNDNYRTSQGGLISIALNSDWVEPKDLNDPREVMAADRALQFQLGWFAHPIFKNGDYPEAMKWQVGNKSELQDESNSRLPSFTEDEKNFIRGTADTFCVNHYTTMIISHVAGKITPLSYEDDQDLSKAPVDYYPWTGIQNQNAVAWGMRRLLNWIKEEYGNPEIYITENGLVTDPMYSFDDVDRIFYYKTYIDEALKAHNIDGVNVKGYIALSLMDSFEWTYSYRKNLGLHHVDFADMARPRTPKRSAHYYSQITRDNGFPLPEEEKFLYSEFPKTFNWSTASAAFQIEGAWRTDGKGLSIWDEFSHTPTKTANGDNGDFACDSYNKIDDDIEVLKTLKVSHYRFSMSWPRVLPDGTKNHINEAGINYYHRLIDALLAANIVPQVTLYHWDLPLALEKDGGWLNETIVDRFRDYADVLFSRFGSKVKFWITHNEPYIVANLGYGYGSFAPGKTGQHYLAAHHLIKSHAEAWHLYNDNYRATQGGIISITVNSDWAEPRNPYKQEDWDACQRYMQFFIGWFAHPIFRGDYPELMKTRIRERSLAAGFPQSRLPEFTPEEIKRINGTYDYFGLNHYCSVLAFHVDFQSNDMHFEADRGTAAMADRTWIETGSDWLRMTPFGFRKLLKFIKDEYGNPPIYVTENGVSERGAVDLNDVHRTYFYKNYINQGLKALILDEVDLRGYTAWSLMDNFEWAQGYTERFGLFYVNRSDPTFPRIPKKAASHYAKIISCNGFPENNPDCEIPDPGDTDAPVPTDSVPTAQSPPPMEVDFLGLELTPEDAEIGLYVTFALLLVSVLAIILTLYGLCRARKMLKKKVMLDSVKLDRM